MPVRAGDTPVVARLVATVRGDAAAGATIDVTVGGAPRAAADAAGPQLPLVTASAHNVAAQAAADELGRPDFGKALRRWLDLERDRMFGELSNLDRVQAVARAYSERARPVERVVERATEPAADRAVPNAAELPAQGGLHLVR